MRMYDIILKKRNGGQLTQSEIEFFIDGYTKGQIPDYQASALMMAIYFNSMTDEETINLTKAMSCSGDMLDLSMFGNLSVDKHSTGGVGDKTTLIVAPIVASLGCKVTKMSGRGLGHTGGTVDKLESIPGYRTELSSEEFIKQVSDIGIAVIGQTGNITPADKKLYSLRDVTATVDNIPLIASSVMSKKIAAGSKVIVLDVKVGSGAFMKKYDDAKLLARKMVDIGNMCKRKTAAIITDMNQPLGYSIGNALEVIEAINVLKGNVSGDILEVSFALAANIVALSFDIPLDEAMLRVSDVLKNGMAFEKMKEWIAAQDGDVSYLDDTSKFEISSVSYDVICESNGFIEKIDAQAIGEVAGLLGAGRCTKDDTIDFGAGIILHKKVGDKVCKGDILCTLYTSDCDRITEAKDRFLSSLVISENICLENSLIFDIIR